MYNVGGFQSNSVGNPDDRFSLDKAHLAVKVRTTYHTTYHSIVSRVMRNVLYIYTVFMTCYS